MVLYFEVLLILGALHQNLLKLMNQNEIKEFLKKKSKNKINSYFKVEELKKQNQSDLMNLLQAWLHSLLYHKRMFPQEAFHQRDILGIPVFVASSLPLKQYLDNFFQKVKQQILHINHLQVIFQSPKDNSIIEVHTIHIEELSLKADDCLSEQIPQFQQNILSKELHIKGFLSTLQQKMRYGFVRKQNNEVTFRLRIGFRYESCEKSNRELLNGWVLKDRLQANGSILCSLVTSKLNLIYQII